MCNPNYSRLRVFFFLNSDRYYRMIADVRAKFFLDNHHSMSNITRYKLCIDTILIFFFWIEGKSALIQ